jgi:hypothetical protein
MFGGDRDIVMYNLQKLMAGNESDYSSVARAVCERYKEEASISHHICCCSFSCRHSDCSKKYIMRICDAVGELFKNKLVCLCMY